MQNINSFMQLTFERARSFPMCFISMLVFFYFFLCHAIYTCYFQFGLWNNFFFHFIVDFNRLKRTHSGILYCRFFFLLLKMKHLFSIEWSPLVWSNQEHYYPHKKHFDWIFVGAKEEKMKLKRRKKNWKSIKLIF